ITPFEARILSTSGLALSGFVGMTILNNWYSRKEEYVNYLLKMNKSGYDEQFKEKLNQNFGIID
ncbi:MAG: hypothetical protein ACLS9A_09150, partial [Clostridia bacterium]